MPAGGSGTASVPAQRLLTMPHPAPRPARTPGASPSGPPTARHRSRAELVVGVVAAFGAVFLLNLLAVGCATETGGRPEPVAHLAACVEEAPDRPCERLPGYDPDYWMTEQADRTDVYLDAAEVCLGALLRGEVVGRRGACTDLYDAYVTDARAGRRDLDGRLDEAQAGRAFGLAYSAVVFQRAQESAEGMTGRDYNAGPLFDGPASDSTDR